VTGFVLDASVAAKWMLPAKNELLRPEAYRLLDDFAAGTVKLVVPDIFWAECGSIVWKAVRQQRFSRANAESAIALMLSREIPTVPSAKLLDDALGIAFDNDRTVYDSLYVALALQSKIPLITADERLANALAARYPVKWLGAL
jgi:predicted nucleic acid-binding protein